MGSYMGIEFCLGSASVQWSGAADAPFGAFQVWARSRNNRPVLVREFNVEMHHDKDAKEKAMAKGKKLADTFVEIINE